MELEPIKIQSEQNAEESIDIRVDLSSELGVCATRGHISMLRTLLSDVTDFWLTAHENSELLDVSDLPTTIFLYRLRNAIVDEGNKIDPYIKQAQEPTS